MSDELTDKLDVKSNEKMSLRVNRPHYFTTRQYVAKMDQILCALELDHVLFPTNAPKEIRRDFDATMDGAKKSISNLREKLLKLAIYTKPSHLSMTKIRSRKRRKDNRLFPNRLVKISQNPSEIETIDITKDVPEIIVITEPEAIAELSSTKEAALSLLSLKSGREKLVEQVNCLSNKPEKSAPILLTHGFCRTGNKIYNLQTSPNKLPITQNINLWRKRISTIMEKQISPLNPVSNSVVVTNPYLPTPAMPIIAKMPDLSSAKPIIEIDGINYSVSVVDFEVAPSKSIDNLNLDIND